MPITHNGVRNCLHAVWLKYQMKDKNDIPIDIIFRDFHLIDVLKNNADTIGKTIPIFSYGFVSKIISKCNLAYKRISKQAKVEFPELNRPMTVYIYYLVKLILSGKYPLEQIMNFDQTPIYKYICQLYSYQPKGKSAEVLKLSGDRERMTVVPTIVANGEALPLYILLKGKTPVVSQYSINNEKLPLDDHLYSMKLGELNEDTILAKLRNQSIISSSDESILPLPLKGEKKRSVPKNDSFSVAKGLHLGPNDPFAKLIKTTELIYAERASASEDQKMIEIQVESEDDDEADEDDREFVSAESELTVDEQKKAAPSRRSKRLEPVDAEHDPIVNLTDESQSNSQLSDSSSGTSSTRIRKPTTPFTIDWDAPQDDELLELSDVDSRSRENIHISNSSTTSSSSSSSTPKVSKPKESKVYVNVKGLKVESEHNPTFIINTPGALEAAGIEDITTKTVPEILNMIISLIPELLEVIKQGKNLKTRLNPSSYNHEVDEVITTKNEKAFFKTDTTIDFLSRIVVNSRISDDVPMLVLLDHCPAHMTQKVLLFLEVNKIDAIFIPRNATSYLQPLDVVINGPLKHNIRNYYSQILFNHSFSKVRGENSKKKRCEHDYVLGVVRAFNAISPEVLNNSFQNTILSCMQKLCTFNDVPFNKFDLAAF